MRIAWEYLFINDLVKDDITELRQKAHGFNRGAIPEKPKLEETSLIYMKMPKSEFFIDY